MMSRASQSMSVKAALDPHQIFSIFILPLQALRLPGLSTSFTRPPHRLRNVYERRLATTPRLRHVGRVTAIFADEYGMNADDARGAKSVLVLQLHDRPGVQFCLGQSFLEQWRCVRTACHIRLDR